MAIKINNTTIIDDGRNIVNAGIVTATSFTGDTMNVGVITATSFVGDGSQLQGVESSGKVFFMSARR